METLKNQTDSCAIYGIVLRRLTAALRNILGRPSHRGGKGAEQLNEEMAMFKSYLRPRMRQPKALKEAMDAQNDGKVSRLLDDTQKSIED